MTSLLHSSPTRTERINKTSNNDEETSRSQLATSWAEMSNVHSVNKMMIALDSNCAIGVYAIDAVRTTSLCLQLFTKGRFRKSARSLSLNVSIFHPRL